MSKPVFYREIWISSQRGDPLPLPVAFLLRPRSRGLKSNHQEHSTFPRFIALWAGENLYFHGYKTFQCRNLQLVRLITNKDLLSCLFSLFNEAQFSNWTISKPTDHHSEKPYSPKRFLTQLAKKHLQIGNSNSWVFFTIVLDAILACITYVTQVISKEEQVFNLWRVHH